MEKVNSDQVLVLAEYYTDEATVYCLLPFSHLLSGAVPDDCSQLSTQ